MGFGITDIIAFAKAGWSPADVKQTIELANKMEQDDNSPEVKDSAVPVQAEHDDAEKPAAAAEPDAQADAVDYKKLYEEQKALTEKLQQENIRQDTSKGFDEKTDQEKLNDIFAAFM